jgi:plastocyanin
MHARRIIIGGSALLAFVMWQAVHARRAHAAENAFEVRGTITLVQDGAHSVADASDVALWLASLDPASRQTAAAHAQYQIVQRDKHFDPDLLVVPVGSVVWFPNRDPWFHNVFSLYRGKRFDLGLYQAGDTKAVKFDRLGPSYIFCNIHPQMAAVVVTVDSQYFGVSDKSGRVNLENVPQGRYRLHVWYENADPSALDQLARDVAVNEDRMLPAISIQVVPNDFRAHKNKYGQNYDTGAFAPEY